MSASESRRGHGGGEPPRRTPVGVGGRDKKKGPGWGKEPARALGMLKRRTQIDATSSFRRCIAREWSCEMRGSLTPSSSPRSLNFTPRK
jgi:hypothetical protein